MATPDEPDRGSNGSSHAERHPPEADPGFACAARSRRWWIAAWLVGVAGLYLLADRLVARAVYAPPSFIEHAPIKTGANPGTVRWEWLWLSMLWTLLVAIAFAVVSFRSRQRAPWIAVLACVALPIGWIATIGALTLGRPGCGSPYRELIEPLPPGVQVLSESVDHNGIHGPGMDRNLILTSDELTDQQVAEATVEAMQDRGWTLELDDLSTTEPGSRTWYTSGPPEWGITVSDARSDEGVSFTLSHMPATGEGCWNE